MCASTAPAIHPGFYEDFENVLQKFQNPGVPAGSDAESDGSVGTAGHLPTGVPNVCSDFSPSEFCVCELFPSE